MSRSQKAYSPPPESTPPPEASPEVPPAAGAPPEDDPIARERDELEASLIAESFETGPTAAGEIPPAPGVPPSFDFSPSIVRKTLDAISKFAAKRVGAKWEANADELDMIAPAVADMLNEYVKPWLPEFLGRHEKLLALGGVLSFYLLPRLLAEDEEPPKVAGVTAPAASA